MITPEDDACPFCGVRNELHAIDCTTLEFDDSDDPPADTSVVVHGRPWTVPDEAPRDPIPTEAQMAKDFALLDDDDDGWLNNDDVQDGA